MMHIRAGAEGAVGRGLWEANRTTWTGPAQL